MKEDVKKIGVLKPLHSFRNDAWKCVKCKVCSMANPQEVKNYRFSSNCISGSYYFYEGYYPPGRFEIVRALTLDPPEIEITQEVIKIVYNCTLCGWCQTICGEMKDLEPTNAFMALREYLVRSGFGPLPAHLEFIKSIKNYDNPWNYPRAQRDRWTKKIDAEVKDATKEEVDILYFVGCTGSYDPGFQEVTFSTVKILNRYGFKVGILGRNERCCGSTMLRVGEVQEFERRKAEILQQLNEVKAKFLVTACAGCYSTFKHSYQDKLNKPVLHMVEFLKKIMEEKGIKFREGIHKRITYHDPCHLGRYFGIYDVPREIISSIPDIEFVEMERIKERSWCCGAGGGVRSGNPELAFNTALERINEAEYYGAEWLVTACPFCEQNLREASKSKNGPAVKDLISIVAEIME